MNHRSNDLKREAAAEVARRYPLLYRWIQEALRAGACPASVKARINAECGLRGRGIVEHAAGMAVDYLAATRRAR